LLADQGLPESVRGLLQQERSAFLLGNTAADVQVVSGQSRQATHFFLVPILPLTPLPWQRMLRRYPVLAQPTAQSPAQAAFLAGYLCHLQADWRWVKELYMPVFGPTCRWANFEQRLYLHNVLRTYLDQQVLAALAPDTGAALAQAAPVNWLPFCDDRYLATWRDVLAEQLRPGATVQTAEVFASRQGRDPQEYYALLASEARLEQEIFSRLPRQQLDVYRQRLLGENAALLGAYLAPTTPRPATETLRTWRRLR
jgi:hypothetical protein